MNFKTKIAYTAVLATLGLAAGSAQAAYLSETGTGEALIYPYYTVQGGFDTYISVVNTTTQAKAVKVRFLEAKASAEVLDFNLYLSPKDVWVGAITPVDRADATKGAKFVANDKSCTNPLRVSGINEPFRSFIYTGDGLGDDITRTREGYVEIIEMGPITNTTMAAGVTHTTAGVPANCAAALNMTSADLGIPSGGLFGAGTLINGAAGTDFTFDAVALEDMYSAAQYSVPGNIAPSLADADSESVSIRANPVSGAREVLTSTWAGLRGIQAVSAVLAHRNVMNEYTVETALNAGTDWVVTFPTKRAHIGTKVSTSIATAPFTQKLTANGACEPVIMQYYDREEQFPTTSVDFSPLPPTGVNSLCWEANVITFKNSKVLSSALVSTNVDVGYQNGWMDLGFADAGHKITSVSTTVNGVAATTATYYGLPAVGFGVERLVNGNVGGVLSNYGGNYAHKYVSQVTLP